MTGVAVTAVARCLAEGCPWTPLAGSSLAGVDKAILGAES